MQDNKLSGGAQTELGVDEAGRGPVLGPMVMAGVLVPKNKKKLLIDWGIKDSKLFGSNAKSKQHREQLSSRITKEFQHLIISISPQKVDSYVKEKNLNLLERETALEIIKKIPADKVILDGENLFKQIANDNIKAINKADSKYLSVSAASILAKAERDKLFSQLCQKYKNTFGEVKGGGYANANTLKFIKWHLGTHGELPCFYRQSYQWKQLKQVLNKP